jgi:hypothetical protein
MMMVDTVSKCYGYTPKLQANKLSTYILHYTMDLNKKGYVCTGIGYWNEILHSLCMISRILYLTTHQDVWFYCFVICGCILHIQSTFWIDGTNRLMTTDSTSNLLNNEMISILFIIYDMFLISSLLFLLLTWINNDALQ